MTPSSARRPESPLGAISPGISVTWVFAFELRVMTACARIKAGQWEGLGNDIVELQGLVHDRIPFRTGGGAPLAN
jgi:hypothetical protein